MDLKTYIAKNRGATAELAEALNVSSQAIRNWCIRGVPAERVIPIWLATGHQVTPHKMRPDIYPDDLADILGDEKDV